MTKATKVLAVWQWWNWLLLFEEPEKPLLVVNWDETACRLHYPTGKGLCARKVSPLAKRLQQPTLSVSIARKRASFTHVALICNDERIQPLLPQVVLGNEHMLTTDVLSALGEAGLPANMQVWRRKSAWVNKETMRDVVREVWKALRPYQEQRQVVLLLDTYSSHCDPVFLQNCARKGIWVVFVPAKQTWLLNPLDTHTFARYKQFLRKDYRRMLAERQGGAVSVADMVCSIGRAVRKVLQAKVWRTAFEENGFGRGRRCARASLLDSMQWSETPCVPSNLPSLAQFELIMPSGRAPPLRELTAPFRHRVPTSASGAGRCDEGERERTERSIAAPPPMRALPAVLAPISPPSSSTGVSPASSSAAPCRAPSAVTLAMRTSTPEPMGLRQLPVGRPLLLRRASRKD